MAGEPEKKQNVNVEIIGNWVKPNELRDQPAGFMTEQRGGLRIRAVVTEEMTQRKPERGKTPSG
ncbi:MAG: hypothetical protein WC759_03985 [Candidatus Micrarchaeia archaeon]|jgi:hypothetical protein